MHTIFDSGSEIRKMFVLADQLRSEGKDPINLALGNPIVPPPDEYFAALQSNVEEARRLASEGINPFSYVPNAGMVDARVRVASDVSDRFGLDFAPEDILLTAGAANGLDVLLSVLIEPPIVRDESGTPFLRDGVLGDDLSLNLDEVVCIAPYFVEYDGYIRQNTGQPTIAHSGKNFRLDINAIGKAITERTKAVILNSPNNPTGVVYTKEELGQLADLLRVKNEDLGTDIVVMEDAPYDRLVWGDAQFQSMLPLYDNTVYTTSGSKSLGVARERAGYVVLHPSMGGAQREILRHALAINLRQRLVNAPGLQQDILRDIGTDVVGDMSEYKRRLDALEGKLQAAGFPLVPAEGAFYTFPKLPICMDDEAMFRRWAHDHSEPLLYTRGAAFGGERYKDHIRLAACATEEDIERACKRLHSLRQTG